MRYTLPLLLAYITLFASGCGEDVTRPRKPADHIPSSKGQYPSGGGSGRGGDKVLASYNTGEDGVQWSVYRFPLVYELPLPAVPERVKGPTASRSAGGVSEGPTP